MKKMGTFSPGLGFADTTLNIPDGATGLMSSGRVQGEELAPAPGEGAAVADGWLLGRVTTAVADGWLLGRVTTAGADDAAGVAVPAQAVRNRASAVAPRLRWEP